MKTQLFIGQSQLRGALPKYAARFNLLELRAEQGRVPRPAILRRWTEEVNREFVFSVLLSRRVADLGGAGEADLKFGLEVANALSAKWLVLQTAPTLGPSQRSRERLKALFDRMRDGERRIAWDPHGVWQEEDALSWTRDLGVHLVRDVTRGDIVEEEILYVRVPGLGTASRLSSGALEKATESLVSAREAYVVLGSEGAARAAQTLRTLVKEAEQWGGERPGTADGPYVFDEETTVGSVDKEDTGADDGEEGESDEAWEDDEAEDEGEEPWDDDEEDEEDDEAEAEDDSSDDEPRGKGKRP